MQEVSTRELAEVRGGQVAQVAERVGLWAATRALAGRAWRAGNLASDLSNFGGFDRAELKRRGDQLYREGYHTLGAD